MSHRRSLVLLTCFLAVGVVATADEPPGGWSESQTEASRFFALQRLPKDGHTDVWKLYERAQQHKAVMPGYSIPLGRHTSSPLEKSGPGGWEDLGPGNLGGRTRALLVHPTKPRILYAAGVAGGVFKTEDGGASWRPLSDLASNLAVDALAMDPDDPEVIYAGTGEGVFPEQERGYSVAVRGNGIFKTTDGGGTWSRLPGTANADFAWVNDLVVSHGNSQRVYAATRTGVWRSKNGGASWTRILDPRSPTGEGRVTGGCLDLEIRTDRPGDVLFASCGNFEQATVYRNPTAHRTAGGWTPVLTEEGMGRTVLALAPSHEDTLYALAESIVPGPGGNFLHGLHAVFRSDVAGVAGSWRAVTRNSDPDKFSTILLSNLILTHQEACHTGRADRYAQRGWYMMVLAVDPLDPEIVFAGGIDLHRSDDGGRSWGPIAFSFNYPPNSHGDHHVIVFHPRYDGVENQTMWVGNDGGVWKATHVRGAKAETPQDVCAKRSDVRWESLDHHLGVTQFYHGAAFPDGRRYLGGTQDNGALRGTDEAGVDGWIMVHRADGGYVAIDPGDPRIVYSEENDLVFKKSTDGGLTFETSMNGLDESSYLFITPFVMDPNDSRRLWLGAGHAWRTDDRALSWEPASPRFATRISALAVAPGDSDFVVAGFENGYVAFNVHATAAGPGSAWPRTRPRKGYVSWLAFDPLDTRRVYATYATYGGKHVWASDDGGRSWRAIDGSGPTRLPNVPAHTIVVDPKDTDRLFLGTDLGVFVSTDRGRSWAAERGFVSTVVEAFDLIVREDGKTFLFAFTHGRGAWRVELGTPTDG